MRRVFIDANIVLDLLDSHRKSHAVSKKVFEKLIEENWEIVISEDILTTIYYIVKDKKAVLDFFQMITAAWKIVSFGPHVISDAITRCRNNVQLDFEDVIQSLSAQESRCEIILSNDKNFFNCGIPVAGSAEFLQKDTV